MSTLVLNSASFDRGVSGHVLAVFNQNVDATDAATTGNFSIPGLTVTGAAYSAGTFTTTLTVTGFAYGTSYTLTVSSVRDNGHSQTIANPNNFSGFYLGGGTGVGAQAYTTPNLLAFSIQHAARTFNVTDSPFSSGGSSVIYPATRLNAGIN